MAALDIAMPSSLGPLPREFFARVALVVARAPIGTRIVVRAFREVAHRADAWPLWPS